MEQKNGAVVRDYAGYDRFEGSEEQALLTAVYAPLAPLLNFFMPTAKLASKTRVGFKETRVYDSPRSPYQRLMEMGALPQEVKDALADQYALYNPYEEQWRETGEKYNIFKVAGIVHKEVRMCQVLTDLLDPHGQHRKGSRYLRLFWKAIAPKLPDCPALNIERTWVTAEYVIDEARRIDITLEDGE